MKRPYLICHMMGTIDGRIEGDRWSLSRAADRQYEAVHALFKAEAWMCGRRTFQLDFLEQVRDAAFSRKAEVPPGDFIAKPPVPVKSGKPGKPVYAIAVDALGKIRWESSDMRGDRLVVLTTGKAPSGYLADLRAKSISYLICGKSDLDFDSALTRLRGLFGIRKLLLEGGGSINGALLAAGLINEISLLVGPFADGARGVPTVFDAPKPGKMATPLRLISAKPRPGGVVWLRYRVA